MRTTIALFTSLLAASGALAHLQLSYPYALHSPLDPQTPEENKDYSITSPLLTDGSYPCKVSYNIAISKGFPFALIGRSSCAEDIKEPLLILLILSDRASSTILRQTCTPGRLGTPDPLSTILLWALPHMVVVHVNYPCHMTAVLLGMSFFLGWVVALSMP